MTTKRILFAGSAAFLCVGLLSFAQGQETYKGRLSPVPIDAKMAPLTTGVGSVTATLAGSKLTVNGTFEAMRGPATAAKLMQSKTTGVRGTAIGDLIVTKAPAGSVSGSVDLTAEQVDHLKKGHLYVQVHSDKAPDGNLWGWLLK